MSVPQISTTPGKQIISGPVVDQQSGDYDREKDVPLDGR